LRRGPRKWKSRKGRSNERQVLELREGVLCVNNQVRLLELEIKHKHGGFNINYEKATVVWRQFGFGS
jgi:hypothetical protein